MSSQQGRRPIGSWHAAALAAFLTAVCAGPAGAQTVLARNAVPGTAVEVAINSTPAGKGAVGAEGHVYVPVNLADATGGKTQIDATLYVDVCGDTLRRVGIVERGAAAAPPADGCERRDIPGIFVVRRVSTLVVDVGAANPTVLLRQGSFRIRPPRVWTPAATGLVIFGGGGLGKYRDVTFVACGAVEGCEGEDAGPVLSGGATYWFSRYFGADVSYFRPPEATAEGSGAGFKFDSAFEADILAVGAKIGVPIGPVRLYGHVGVNYHEATATTNQTIDEAKITVDGVERTIPGGTQTFTLVTEGWGWQFGGGFEAWLGRRAALYVEGGNILLTGKAAGGGEGELDDRVSYAVAGVRVRVF